MHEADGGETTDEEDFSPAKKLLVIDSAEASDEAIVEENVKAKESASPTKRATPARKNTSGEKKTKQSPPGDARRPKLGTFELDPRRTVLIVDGTGVLQKNTLYPAQIQTPQEKQFWTKLRRVYNARKASPRTSIHMAAEEDSDVDIASMIFNPMDSDMFSPSGSLVPGSILGPPEAFVPFTSVDATGAVTEDASMVSASDDEEMFDPISPFVDFSAISSDDDEEDDTSDTAPSARRRSLPTASTPFTQGTPSRHGSFGSDDGGDDLWSHLRRSRGLVHSFRDNQQRARTLASRASHPAARASAAEHNAILTGRRKAGNTPITPLSTLR